MTYKAIVIEVFIASPSDVVEARQTVRDVVTEWNVIYSRDRLVVLMPVGWETHSAPELGGRPQQMINDRLLEHAEYLIGIFWTRIGTPTGDADSGTIEEIERHLAQGKPASLYFSEMPVAPGSYDESQFSRLQQFKEWARRKGIVEGFSNLDEFRAKLSRHLPLNLSSNPYLREKMQANDATPSERGEDRPGGALSADERDMLSEMVRDENGELFVGRSIGGTSIQVGSRNFAEPGDRRTLARWEAVVDDLERKGLVVDRNGTRELYTVTASGYGVVDS